MERHAQKIFVGLSGGVDSSVAAALLKEQGHNVTGVFIKVWQPDFLPCTWREDRYDAMRVCAQLNIPFQTLDLSDVYKRDVVDYMIREYTAGRTPNPDIMCNQYVKFGAFLNWAKRLGADAIATGHYARSNLNHNVGLYVSADSKKDQTYFLWTLKTELLSSIYFPVGEMKKEETRKKAKHEGLKTAEKKDSQGLCFLGKLDMKEFLAHFIKAKPGKVYDKNGKEVGVHEGALFYTLGQRHGFTVTSRDIHDPLYIIDKDIHRNTLIVDINPYPEKPEKETEITGVNWIGDTPREKVRYQARVRHHGEYIPVYVSHQSSSSARITFLEETPLISKGQSLVLYLKEKEGTRCMGGGVLS